MIIQPTIYVPFKRPPEEESQENPIEIWGRGANPANGNRTTVICSRNSDWVERRKKKNQINMLGKHIK